MRDRRDASRFSFAETAGKKPRAGCSCKWEDSIKMDFKETICHRIGGRGGFF
jgi:hypothetical protein